MSFVHPTEPLSEVPTGTRLTPEQEAVVASNLGLIGRVVKPGRLDYDDAFQNGVLGLARAAQKFDPSKGFALSTYATWWIKRYVQEAGELSSEHGPKNYRRAMANHTTLEPLAALDRPLAEDGGTLADYLVGTDDPEAEAVSRAALVELVESLARVAKDETDRRIIGALLERSPPSLTSIGSRHGMSRGAVSQRLLRLRSRSRHPSFRKKQPMDDQTTTATETHTCPDCGQNGFKTPQAVGAHRRYTHAPAARPETKTARRIARAARQTSRLDATSIKADLYDARDDYDPWVVIVGHGTKDGAKAEAMVLSTDVDAEQVVRTLDALGHRAWRFRLADGAPK